MKIPKNNIFFWGGGGRGVGEGWVGGIGGGGVRVDVNEKLKFCENLKRKIFFLGGGGGRGSGWGGGGGGGQG